MNEWGALTVKINGIAGVAGVYGPKGPRKPGGKRAEQTNEADKVTVSSEAREAMALRAKLDAAPDVRTEKVEAIRQRLNAGTYRPSAHDVAERLLRAKILDDLA